MRMRWSPAAAVTLIISLSALVAFALVAFAAPLMARDRTPKVDAAQESPAKGGPRAMLEAPKRKAARAQQNRGEIENAHQDYQYQPLLPNMFAAFFRAPIELRATRTPRANTAHSFGEIDGAIARHAMAAGVPVELAMRVVKRESGGNPRAVSQGNYGLMQIRLGTAQAMGYRGNAQGLLDAETNMTYAMKYLAGAYRAAGGSHDGAIRLYSRGYYHEAKRQGFSAYEPPSTVAAN